MNEFPDAPSEPAAPPPRFRWRNLVLVILAVVLIIYGLAYMSGGKRGVWGASHTPQAHR